LETFRGKKKCCLLDARNTKAQSGESLFLQNCKSPSRVCHNQGTPNERRFVNVNPVSAKEAMVRMALPMGQPGAYSAIIDARSEDEFALDHLPGAVNWPSLNNEQRIVVGTLYKQVGPFEAKKKGAGLVAANIASHIEKHVIDLPKDWQPLVYCWRGGKRSGSLALILGQIGFKVAIIEGGYKAFRSELVTAIPPLAERIQWRVICGPTGSGKTRLLHCLQAQGAQVLDLEGLANHRSSVLGFIPGEPQPSQKNFDTLIWDALRQMDPAKPVYVESESRKVGNLAVPESLIVAVRSGQCYQLELSDDERVKLLLEDYEFFVKDPTLFAKKLDALVAIRGKQQIETWQSHIAQGQIDIVVRELLTMHYDPTYFASMKRNFSHIENAKALKAQSRSMDGLTAIAKELVLA
jgi:tRNA 2-selenouridine synthase